MASKSSRTLNSVTNKLSVTKQSPAKKTVFAKSAETTSVQSELRENGVKVRDDDKTPQKSPNESEMSQQNQENEDSVSHDMDLSEKDEEMLLAEEEAEHVEETTQKEVQDELSDAASPETRRSPRSRRSRHSRKT